MVESGVQGPSWADLIFHVFAHVPVPMRVPASLFDAAYVSWVTRRLGPLGRRPLGQDRERLAALFGDHRRLAHVQWMAALFEDLEAARAAGEHPLSALSAEHGCSVEVANVLLRDPLAAELLWAAALLELPDYLRLPALHYDAAALQAQLARVVAVAPHLARCEVRLARALGRRGRVIEGRIWVGAEDLEHAAWQAAHEATVAEVRGGVRSGEWAGHRPLGQALGEREAEAVALVLLAERSRRAGMRAEHRHFRDGWSIAPEHCLPSHLTPAQRARFDMLWG